MSDKIAVLTNAFQEKKLITNCIKQFKPYNLFHLVLCPNKSWNGDMLQDETPDVARKAGASLVVEGDWKTEQQQFNYGLNLLTEYDWVIICDADERYLKNSIDNITELLQHNNYDGVKSHMKVYWKTKDYQIIPDQTDYPLIAVKPSVNFYKARAADITNFCWTIEVMHHLSYVRSDEEMLKKIKTFSHADEFDFMNWYNNVWLKWEPSMTNLHPVVPEQFEQAVFDPLPREIFV